MNFTRTALSLLAGLVPLAVSAQTVNENDPAVVTARAHFAANAQAYGLSNPAAELQLRTVRTDHGVGHVRFNQYYKGVPVFGGEAIAHVDSKGAVTVTSAIARGLVVDVTPRLNRQAAIEAASRVAGIQGAYVAETADLKVLPAGEWTPRAVLVWHIQVNAENDVDLAKHWDVFVSAQDGSIVKAFDSLHTAASRATLTGNTMWSGTVSMPGLKYNNVYVLYNYDQAGMTTRNLNHGTSGTGSVMYSTTTTFGNGDKANTDPNTAGADAHFGGVKTWDYYKTTFGRNGIDNAGRTTYSRVHYSTNYENAFWSDSCFCMTYGDGRTTFYTLTALDVAGHEMSHGVMASEANLTYAGESGGLNESNSDIFGTMVEYYVNNASDVPDYWIGERIFRANWPTPTTYVQTQALRYMDDPHKDGISPACWYSGIGNIDVHYSSGPNNHMFYLLAEGGTSKCNGKVVTGIGRAKAAAIWYNAICNYMSANTNYAAAKTAALGSAAQLYGAGSAEYNAVIAAYAAINVN